jgi:hypothetical protein
MTQATFPGLAVYTLLGAFDQVPNRCAEDAPAGGFRQRGPGRGFPSAAPRPDAQLHGGPHEHPPPR